MAGIDRHLQLGTGSSLVVEQKSRTFYGWTFQRQMANSAEKIPGGLILIKLPQ
ncbi:hypothetical protein [Blautia wexlerae]|jgi:hypothetical protein|uniref:hypothetical protein n=1 Tax=Blautia wexlerae TaxID=418240 RepID=UPI0012E1883A|nr:hypothetical protein [Blautia wexlerae]MZT63051.1 hypothetical protein [Blautia wexlerae]